MRRSIPIVIAATLVSAAVVSADVDRVDAVATFELVEEDDARIALDVTPNGRHLLTSALVTGQRRVIDRLTGSVVVLPDAASSASILSDDGGSVLFSTTAALSPSDGDSLLDAYIYDIDTPSFFLLSPGNPGSEMTAVAIGTDPSVTLVQQMPDGSGTVPSRAFVSNGTTLTELGATLGAAQSRPVALSSDGRYALFQKEQCPTSVSCGGVFAMWRADLSTGTTVPVGRAADGSAHAAFTAVMSADGSCVAYTTLTPRAVWKDCGFANGTTAQVASAWEYIFAAGNLSISADGSTVGWLQTTQSEGPTPGLALLPHLHARTGTAPAVVVSAATGRMPWGSATGGFVLDPGAAILNMSATNLVPGNGNHRILAYEDVLPPAPSVTPGAAVFTARTPLRILDTRTGLGASPGMRAAGMEIDVPIAGRHGVPTSATAVAVQVTATEGTSAGFVSVLPGLSRPGRTSNLNVDPGETIANAAVVPIGPDGTIRVYTSAPAHLILDLAGWWTPVGAATSGGRFQAVGPARVLDTRPESPVGSNGVKPAAGSVTVVQATGRNGLPATGVAAVVVNVTIVDPSSLGFVQAAPASSLVPGASSTLNVGAPGQVIAASAIVPVDAAGRFAIYTQPSTHLVVDVAGWFTDGTVAAGVDGMFVADSVVRRALDTRGDLGNGPRLATGSRTVLAAPAGAVVGNVTVTDTAGAGFVQLGPNDSMVNGATSNINPTRAGETVANAFIVPTGAGSLGIFTSDATHVIVDVSGYMTP